MGITFYCRKSTHVAHKYTSQIYIYLYIFLSAFKSITNKCTFHNIILYQSYNHSTKSLALYEKNKTYHIIHLNNDHLSLCFNNRALFFSHRIKYMKGLKTMLNCKNVGLAIFPVFLTLISKYIFLLI